MRRYAALGKKLLDSLDESVLIDNPVDCRGTRQMEFHLVYAGDLLAAGRANTRVREKHAIQAAISCDAPARNPSGRGKAVRFEGSRVRKRWNKNSAIPWCTVSCQPSPMPATLVANKSQPERLLGIVMSKFSPLFLISQLTSKEEQVALRPQTLQALPPSSRLLVGLQCRARGDNQIKAHKIS